MKHILAKVDRIRANGSAIVETSGYLPHAIHDGKIFKSKHGYPAERG